MAALLLHRNELSFDEARSRARVKPDKVLDPERREADPGVVERPEVGCDDDEAGDETETKMNFTSKMKSKDKKAAKNSKCLKILLHYL